MLIDKIEQRLTLLLKKDKEDSNLLMNQLK